MAPAAAILRRSLRVHQIYGANTEIGKTVISTILCNATAKHWKNEKVSYLKPVSTGPANEVDSRYGTDLEKAWSTHAPLTDTKTLFQYDIACSPHSAAAVSGKLIPSDNALLAKIHEHVAHRSALGPGWLFLETAGGVHSPGPSGSSQADIYASLRLPVVLVGDSRLGGISQTISAYESLKMRGYDIESVLMFRNKQYENHDYLAEYFKRQSNIPLETVPEPPAWARGEQEEIAQMQEYYEKVSSDDSILKVLKKLDQRGKDRISRLEDMSKKANDTIWYPFTQQKLVSPKTISTIDSANGDYFQVFTGNEASSSEDKALLQPAFDGSASWWTQGLGHANPRLTLAAAYAAGRYGHVMFAEAIHEPALKLAETLLEGLQNPRMTRVFYSDNGSTGCEVATKMALRAARNRYGWGPREKIDILGLKGSYHGDTIGAMDCAEPCTFNEKVEWYQGKGYWFDYPVVRCTGGKWVVEVPESLRDDLGDGSEISSLSGVFDLEGRATNGEVKKYERYIESVLKRLQEQGRKFGALMMEPVILGAGGMIFIDPLFQKTLVDVVRRSPHFFGDAKEPTSTDQNGWSGLPVIFDEVFTGLYRLGRFKASSFIGTNPDISVHAKLLTGGLLPLCATVASDSVFNSFESDDKSDALLHGHSYTAHAVGCQVALESLNEMKGMDSRGDWQWAKSSDWTDQSDIQFSGDIQPWSTWSHQFVDRVSRQTEQVVGVWALGSVLAITMRGYDEAGYKSKASMKLQAALRDGDGSWNTHSRVLGNVFYIMAGQKTSQESVQELQSLLLKALKS